MKKSQAYNQPKLVGLIIPSIILITATILNYYLRQGLFIKGVNMIANMQKNSGALLDFVENVFSFIANFMVFIIIGVKYLYVKQRIRTIVTIIYAMIGLYFIVVLKQSFQQSRPFWYNQIIDIIQWFCPTDFGNPSGHCFIFFAIYQPLISDFWGTGKNKILVWIWVVVGVLVAISRMYLGAHSLDQVVYGSLIGLSFLVIYKFWLQAFLYKTLIDMLNNKNKKIYTIINSVLWVLFLIVPLVSYHLNTTQRPIDYNIINNINTKCSLSKSGEHYQRSILNSAITAYLAFGIIFGFVFLKNQNGEDSSYMGGLWAYTNRKSLISYLVAIIIIVGGPTLIFVVLIPSIISNPYVGYVLRAIGATWAGFALIYPMMFIQKRFSMIRLDPSDQTE